MTITLPPEQIAWLEKFAQDRGFASASEAARALIAGAMLEETEDPDLDGLDPEWVIPLLDEARAEIERGEGIGLDDFLKHFDEHMHRLRQG